MQPEVFKALNIHKRWEVVRSQGIPVAKRYYRGFDVQLYALGLIYVETWSRTGLSMIEWIEVMPTQRVADVYGADLKEILNS
jgi:hypothetical protein